MVNYCIKFTLILPVFSGLQIRVRNQKLFFLFLNQNICCGCSKEPSHWDGSFEQPKQMLKLIDKKILAILRRKFVPIWTYDFVLRIYAAYIPVHSRILLLR